MKLINLILTLGLMTILSACGGGGGGGGGTGGSPAPPSIPICLDSNSSNLGQSTPCICNAGYEISPDGTSCSAPTGTAYTYSASYTSYSPAQSATTACSGTVTTTRTMTCVRSDSLVVSNSFCSADPNPTSTVLSKAGSVIVTPTNPSLANGTEYLTCVAGATTGTRSILCDANYTILGSTLATQTCVAAAYNATFSTYSPTQAATTACSGTVTTTRTISSCRRVSDNVLVSNSLCTDPTPNSTVLSKPGVVAVTPTNPSLSNGFQYKSCLEGQTSGTEYISCSSNYHTEGSTLANQNCYSNTRSCSPMPIGVTAGTQTWDGSSYGTCVATACNTGAGYSLSSGTCSLVSERLMFKSKFAIQIMPDNTLKGWGLNEQSQLGQGDTSNKASPVTINLGTGLTAKKVYTNGLSTCAILNDNSVKCWGSNTSGQLGVGDTTARTSPTAVNLGVGKTAKEIIVGGLSYCAILNDNSLSCWGKNSNGELGSGSTSNLTSPNAVNVGSGRTVSKVIMTQSSSNNTTCAILDDASVKCWGYNAQGQVADGTTTDRSSPSAVKLTPSTFLTSVKDIMFTSNYLSPDSVSVCAILNNDSLSCWGYNANGRLGLNDTANRTYASAVSVGVGRTVKKMYGSLAGFMCVIMDDSNVKCWGKNDAGQLGDNSTTERTYPVAITFPSSKTVKELVLGNLGSNCAIHTDNSLSCWGNNYRGQLGLGTNDITVYVPTAVNLSSKTVKSVVSTSDYVTCLILNDSTVKCSGDNVYGSQGTGVSQFYTTSFADVNLGSGITAVELRSEYYGVCALASDNKVYCWGSNEKGKTGYGSLATTYTTTPYEVNY